MDEPLEPPHKPPLPPQAFAPAPPPLALTKPSATHVPLTPMMEFLQRRLEGLEKELSVERERAHAAQSLLQQQESLRSQVEEQLKAMSDTLRREKAERESEEVKSHARGRIDSLEKRLDEMHQSWVALLRDAMTQRESTHNAVSASQEHLVKEQAALKQEIGVLQSAIHGLLEQIELWRAESRSVAEVLPEIKSLATRLPAESRRFEGQISEQLSNLNGDLRERLASFERKQAIEMEKGEQRLQAFAREKAALLQAIEEQNHQTRSDSIKDRVHRETQNAEQIAELASRLDQLRAENVEATAALKRVVDAVTATPKAKDEVIDALEREKLQLVDSLKERSQALQDFLGQRREAEKALSDAAAALRRELDDANNQHRLLLARCAELELEQNRLKDAVDPWRRQAQEGDQRRKALEDERDQIAKALVAEAERARALVEQRAQGDDAWAKRLSELQARLAAEIEARSHEAATAADLRAQLATLTDHMARTLQERDNAANRTASGDKERAELLKRLQEKEDMISMLNSTFQKLIKESK